MKRFMLGAVLAAAIAACETAPPAPVAMDEAAFQAAVTEAKDEWHAYATIESLSAILEDRELSDTQEVQLRFERGAARRLARVNLPGAIEDFETALALGPDAAFAESLETELEYAKTDLDNTGVRLQGMQTLPEWFDEMVARGELATAAERFRKSGLSPDEKHASLLEAAGYLCGDESEDDMDWSLGSDIEHLKDVEWCDAPADT